MWDCRSLSLSLCLSLSLSLKFPNLILFSVRQCKSAACRIDVVQPLDTNTA